ncbi:T9SS type B sorting domain-containing protein [Tenacibaculum sp. 190524A02b]|uniref:T9SS type B sorting domain-containing protein n=1 Tax=Tenacibaculum vairaonense TaxID=3137860 RepID=UPI0031FAB2A3
MKKLLTLLALFVVFLTHAQKEANIWYFGQKSGLNFNTIPPTALNDGALSTLEGCSSFSDANGNLLFYSDGIKVYDKNHQIMTFTNGILANNLKGDPSSTQSGMIIPKPKSNSIYYLFTVDDGPRIDFSTGQIIENGKGFNVYTIDMSLNSGLGQLIDEDNDGVFFKDLSDGKFNDWTEKVAAVRGSECNTFWVVSCNDNEFYAYKIDENGINATPVISPANALITRRGYLKLSPDGSKLAVANQGNNESLLYSFDNLTGKLSSTQTQLTTWNDGQAYGIEFSRNSTKLYVSTTEFFTDDITNPSTYKLFQFDLTSDDIRNSKELIHRQDGFRGALQLGPNGKIYATIPQSYSNPGGFATHLDVIENPNAPASDIRFIENAIPLNKTLSTQGLPPFISSLLLPIEIKELSSNELVNDKTLQFCKGDSKTINSEIVTGSSVRYDWVFDNGVTKTSISTTSSLELLNIDANSAGEYKLTVTLTDSCGNDVKKEGSFKVEVYEATNATQPSNINFCDIDNDGFNTFDLQNDVTPTILNGQDPDIFEIVYYLSQDDANNNNITNALANPYTNTTPFANNIVYARMHNKVAPNACYDIKTFNLSVTGNPEPQTPSPYNLCDDTTSGSDIDGINTNFLLNTKDSEILGSLDPSLYKVTYYKSLIGAQTDNSANVINKNIPYQNETKDSQTIYVRVENRNNSICNDSSVSFNLVVNKLPEINSTVTLKQCDNDTDAFANFNLNEVRSKISSNYENETFVYFESPSDALSGIAPIPNPLSYQNKTATSDKIWTTVTNSNGCKRIAEVNLIVSTTGIPSNFQTLAFNSCDDIFDNNGTNSDLDGISTFDFSDADRKIRGLFTAVGQAIQVTYYENENDALAETNAISDISNHRNTNSPFTQNIYVRVDSELSNDCLGLGHHITLTVNPLPIFDITTTSDLVCLNNPQVRLEVINNNATYSYEWTRIGSSGVLNATNFIDIDKGGTYIVTATTQDGTLCSRSQEITIAQSTSPTLTDNDVIIVDDTNNDQTNTYTIKIRTTNLGIGDYQFALIDKKNNQTPFQDNPFFTNLSGGFYTILVNDKNGCVPDAMLEVAIVQFQKFFTPNGDGVYDTWKIKGANATFFPSSEISIFNRYGKLVAKIPIESEGWDGTFNGKVLPSNDYWFNVQLTDRKGRKFEHQGHFSLLRK